MPPKSLYLTAYKYYIHAAAALSNAIFRRFFCRLNARADASALV